MKGCLTTLLAASAANVISGLAIDAKASHKKSGALVKAGTLDRRADEISLTWELDTRFDATDSSTILIYTVPTIIHTDQATNDPQRPLNLVFDTGSDKACVHGPCVILGHLNANYV